MSKPFLIKEIKETRIAIHTTNNVSSVVLDQAATEDTIVIETTAVTAGVLLAGGSEDNAIQLFDGDVFVFTPNGNLVETAGQIFENASSLHQQSMLTAANRVTLSPAASLYNELNNGIAPGLNQSSRINIAPPAGGTVINSIVVVGSPDGRELWVQNVNPPGGDALTLTNQSGAGTLGGRFQGPGDYVIPAGGGASIMLDQTALAGEGAWLVRGI
jgi:hypothetical protein